jgi:serine protease Do
MSDLAVIKVSRNNLRPLPFADSEAVKSGQMVVAVGSPFGLQQSITFGHVSAINRSNQWAGGGFGTVARPYFDMIQTDAAINPGNSGGPLLNIRGEIVGINTAINTTIGQNSGVGFAIPANMAKVVATALANDGKVTRAYLGLTPGNLLGYEAEEKGVASGAIVKQVQADAPAGKAGLKEGDVIVKIGETPVRGELDVRNSMITYKPKQKVPVTYVREGKTLIAQVELADRPENLEASDAPGRTPDIRDPFGWFGPPSGGSETAPGQPAKLGVSVAELTDENRSLSPTGKGVLITAVEPGSAAARAGIRADTVLLKVGDTEITSAEQLRETVAKFKTGDRTMITVARQTRAGVAQMTATIVF